MNENNPSSELVLDGEELELASIAINGEKLSENAYKIDAKKLTIFSVPDNFELETVSYCQPIKNKSLSGLYVSSGNFCTQCEAEGFRRITWFLDRPDVLSKFTCTLVAEAEKYPFMLSNGNFIEKKILENGLSEVKWVDPFLKPAYLFAVVAGDFDLLKDTFITCSGRTIELHIYVEKGELHRSQHCMDSLKNSMKWDEERFGREYDLDLFQIVAVSDFNMGAMENKGLNVFNTKYVLAEPQSATDNDYAGVEAVVGHEYFHNWSGNRVTCRSWFELSLKEGFTVFRDQEFSADLGSRAVKRIEDVVRLRRYQMVEDASPMSHPIRPDSFVEINNFYTATVYEKGAEVIRMIHTLLGEKVFRKACDLYFDKFDGQAATCDDFIACMAEVSGRDFTQFSLWYSQSGTPKVTVKSQYNEESQVLMLNIKQDIPKQADSRPTHAMLIPLKIGLLSAEGVELPLHQTGKASQHDLIELSQLEQEVRFEKIAEKPILSILREFSAPVLLESDVSDKELILRMKSDSDAFNRYDASQEYALTLILKMVSHLENNGQLKNLECEISADYIAAFKHNIEDNQSDKALLAYLLTIPSVESIASRQKTIQVEHNYKAREFLTQQISMQLSSELYALYASLENEADYSFDAESVARRALLNRSLTLISSLKTVDSIALVKKQYANATQMNDRLHAFGLLCQMSDTYSKDAIADFYSKYEKDALTLDKWFALQAISEQEGTLERVKALMNNPMFSIENPNKVRSVIGAFSSQNMLHFHAKDGSGYAFLADQIIVLDSFNPQIAARLVKALSTHARHTNDRAELMKLELKRIQKIENLSRDVSEIVEKSLN